MRQRVAKDGARTWSVRALRSPDVAGALGSRIRMLRQQRGLTLAGLAAIVGVSRSFLSQVENGFCNPSLETLRRLASALGVPMFSLLDEPRPNRVVVRRGERKRIRAPHARVEYELLSPDLQRNIEMLSLELDPGEATSASPCGHGGEECAIVIRGLARVELGDEYFDLEQGDTIYFDAQIPHRVINIGRTRLWMISAITPPSF
jgi:transcriptional regulator with XRE-family HTH domain